MNDYILKEEIGTGRMSVVYKGRKKRTINFFAIYAVEKCKRERVLHNVTILRTMADVNAIQFHNWYETTNHLWVITELCVGGDLRSILAQCGRMKEVSVRLLGSDIAAGLCRIHAKGFVYRDLKPANLLMDSTATMRYYDFGLACVFGAASEQRIAGTPLYMAPELFVTDGGASNKGPTPGVPSTASDLWSLGCVLYEMAAGENPFAGKDLEEVLRNVFTKQPARLEHMSDAFNNLVESLLVKDPLKRAVWADVLASEFWCGALDELAKSAGVAPEPALAAYRREVENSRRRTTVPASAASPWSAAEVEAAVVGAVAAAKANLMSAPTTATDADDDSYGEVHPARELSFAPVAAAAAGAGKEPAPSPRPTGASASGAMAQTVASTAGAGAVRTPLHSHRRIRTGSQGDGCGETGVSRRRPSSHAAGDVGGRRGSQVSPRVGANGSATSRPLTYLDATERQDGRRLEIVGGALLATANPCDMVWHGSDNNIRPLCANARIEKYVEPPYDPSRLGFKPRTRADLKGVAEREVDIFIRGVYKSLSGSASAPATRENVLKYLESLASEVNIANTLVNSSIMTLCVDLMEAAAMPVTLRTAAASLAGMLVRFAISVSLQVARSKIIPRLLRLFETETDIVFKRKLFVCIGEVVFYVYAQKEDYNREPWCIVPGDLQRVFLKALGTNDDMIRHYAAKTIENLSTSYDKAECLCVPPVVEGLLGIYDLPPASTRNTHMRSSALCAALRLATLREELIPIIMASECLPQRAYGQVLCSTSIARTGQVLMSFLIVALLKAMAATSNPFTAAWAAMPGASRGARAMLASTLKRADAEMIIHRIAELSEELADCLCEYVERSSLPLRGKSLLFYLVLGCLGGTVLPKVCTSRNVAFLDRTMRESDDYVQRCSAAVGGLFSIYAYDKLAAVTRRATAATAPLYLSSLQQLLSASAVRSHMELPSDVFKHLAEGVQKAMTSSVYTPFENDFDALADRILQAPEAVVRYSEPICAYLVEAYTDMLQRKEGQRRFTALRMLVSVFAPLASDSRVARDQSGSVSGSASRAVVATLTVTKRSLPGLLAEASPIPHYTLRLVALCGECSPVALHAVMSSGFLTQVLSYLSTSGTESDVFYPLKLVLAAIQCGEGDEDVALVVRRKLIPILLTALRAALDAGMSHVLEVGCELAALLVTRTTAPGAKSTAERCVEELMEGDALETVFLPLTSLQSCGSLLNESAACVVYNLVLHSSAAQRVMLSKAGVRALCDVLTQRPLNGKAAELMLKATGLAGKQSDLQQRLGSERRVMAALDGLSGGNVPRSVSVEAARLAEFIRV